MTLRQQIDDIKTFIADRVEDGRIGIEGADTDTLFDMLDAAIAAAGDDGSNGGFQVTGVGFQREVK